MEKTNGAVRIVADDRENAGGVIDELRRRTDVNLTVDRLSVGDFLVGDDVVVERKTLRDFAISVVDGRWFRQTAGMMSSGVRRGVVVLEGVPESASQLGVSRDSLQGALITATVFYGLPVLRAADVAETSRLLVFLGRQLHRVVSGALPRHGYRPKGKRARQIFILQGLPAVGADRAAKLLEHFGTVERIASATLDELAAVNGIGQSTADKIRWALT